MRLLHSNVKSQNILHLLCRCNYNLDQKSNLYNNPKGLGLTIKGGVGGVGQHFGLLTQINPHQVLDPHHYSIPYHKKYMNYNVRAYGHL